MRDGAMIVANRPAEKILAAICVIAARGEAERGADGVVLFNRQDESAAWVKVSELSAEELRDVAAELLTEEGQRYFFVMEEDTGSGQVHIWKLSRQEVAERASP